VHGELALLVATRLTSAWGSDLTVATFVDAEADDDERLRAEVDLEAVVGISVRTHVRAIPTSLPEEVLAVEAGWSDLIVLGVSALGEERVAPAVERLEAVKGCSLALIRAHAASAAEVGRQG
jgi:hypothetical protein